MTTESHPVAVLMGRQKIGVCCGTDHLVGNHHPFIDYFEKVILLVPCEMFSELLDRLPQSPVVPAKQGSRAGRFDRGGCSTTDLTTRRIYSLALFVRGDLRCWGSSMVFLSCYYDD